MAAAAIIIEALFFALAFGLRSIIQYRRTGSSGFHVPGPDAGAAERVGSGLFVLALVLIVAAPVGALAGWGVAEVPGWVGAVGAALAVAGSAATVWAQLEMGESWRIGVDPEERTELVTGGVYGFVRNPIFTAMLAATVGLALMVPSWVSVAAAVTLLVALEVQVRMVEEPYLATVHGESYARYRRQAGRFFPGMGTS